MKRRTLYLIYMKRVIVLFFVAGFLNLIFLESSLLPTLYQMEEVKRVREGFVEIKMQYIQASNLLFLFTVVWFCFGMLRLLRSTRGKGRDEFLYASPMTKMTQSQVLSQVSISLAGGLVLLAEFLLLSRTTMSGEIWERILSCLVKMVVLVFVGEWLIWLHSRGDFTGKRILWLSFMLVSGGWLLYGILKLVQILLPYQWNHPFNMLQNIWRGLTYPQESFQWVEKEKDYHGFDALFIQAKSGTKVVAGVIVILLFLGGAYWFSRRAIRNQKRVKIEQDNQVCWTFRQKSICFCIYMTLLGACISMKSFSIYEWDQSVLGEDGEGRELGVSLSKGFLDMLFDEPSRLDTKAGDEVFDMEEIHDVSEIRKGRFWLAIRYYQTYASYGDVEGNYFPIVYDYVDKRVTTNAVRVACLFITLFFTGSSIVLCYCLYRRKERREKHV